MKPISQWPKSILAFVVIAGGILLIVLSDPPKNECDAQLEVFKQNQQGFLFEKVEKKKTYKPLFERLFKNCANTNSAGGCYELFAQLRLFIQETSMVRADCNDKFKNEKVVKQALLNSYDLIVRLAWGDSPPVEAYVKAGWYDDSEIILFCDIQKQIKTFFGEDYITKLNASYIETLPGAEELDRNEAWSRMLLSVSCSSY